jgi:hypothetical protein
MAGIVAIRYNCVSAFRPSQAATRVVCINFELIHSLSSAVYSLCPLTLRVGLDIGHCELLAEFIFHTRLDLLPFADRFVFETFACYTPVTP